MANASKRSNGPHHSFGQGGEAGGALHPPNPSSQLYHPDQHQAMTELSVGPSVFDPANLGSLVSGDARESTSKPAVGVPEKKK
jgi:hypothetical protein